MSHSYKTLGHPVSGPTSQPDTGEVSLSVPRSPASGRKGPLAEAREDAATEAVLAQLGEIPRWVRVFDTSSQEATGRLRIKPDLLARLESLSLAEQRDGQTYIDSQDLINTQYRLGGGLLTMGLLALWPKVLTRLPAAGPVALDVGFDARCPHPGHPGTCDFTMVLPDGRSYQIETPAGPGQPLVWVRFDLPTRWPELPSAVREIIDEMQDIRFVLLRHHVAWDEAAFVRRTGLADCQAFVRLLIERASGCGVPMRPFYGLLAAPPMARSHTWAEVEVGEIWVPIDPLLINTLVAHNFLDRESWPPHRSPGATFCPLGDTYRPLLVTHRGDRVYEVTACSRLVS